MSLHSTVTKEIKSDTEQIKEDTMAIKGDTTEIIALIQRLEQLQREGAAPRDQFMLQRYLDELTNYAETVYQESRADGGEMLEYRRSRSWSPPLRSASASPGKGISTPDKDNETQSAVHPSSVGKDFHPNNEQNHSTVSTMKADIPADPLTKEPLSGESRPKSKVEKEDYHHHINANKVIEELHEQKLDVAHEKSGVKTAIAGLHAFSNDTSASEEVVKGRSQGSGTERGSVQERDLGSSMSSSSTERASPTIDTAWLEPERPRRKPNHISSRTMTSVQEKKNPTRTSHTPENDLHVDAPTRFEGDIKEHSQRAPAAAPATATHTPSELDPLVVEKRRLEHHFEPTLSPERSLAASKPSCSPSRDETRDQSESSGRANMLPQSTSTRRLRRSGFAEDQRADWTKSNSTEPSVYDIPADGRLSTSGRSVKREHLNPETGRRSTNNRPSSPSATGRGQFVNTVASSEPQNTSNQPISPVPSAKIKKIDRSTADEYLSSRTTLVPPGESQSINPITKSVYDIRVNCFELQLILPKTDVSSVKALLARGLDPNTNRSDVYVPREICLEEATKLGISLDEYMNTIQRYPIQNAVINRNHACLAALLEAGADPNRQVIGKAPSSLILAAERNDHKSLRLLLSSKADPNLRYATAERNDHESVRLLLPSKADPSLGYVIGKTEETTALITGIENGYHEIVVSLLRAGANVNDILPVTGASSIRLSARSGQNRWKGTPLYFAVSTNVPSMAICATLLVHGADVNPEISLLAPLNAAITSMKPARKKELFVIIKLLLRNNAKTNEKDRYSAISCAISLREQEETQQELIRLLLEHGADVNAPARWYWGPSPLVEATEKGDLKLVQLLLECGADRRRTGNGIKVNAWDVSNVFEMAASKSHTTILQTLLKGLSLSEQSEHIKDGRLLHFAIAAISESSESRLGITPDQTRNVKDMLKFLIQAGANTRPAIIAYRKKKIIGSGEIFPELISVKKLAADIEMPKGVKRKQLFKEVGLEL